MDAPMTSGAGSASQAMSVGAPTSHASLAVSVASQDARTEIATASVVCGTCQRKCALTWRTCPICEAAPRLRVGGYNFVGQKKALYDASTGAALANSIVFLARARSIAVEGTGAGKGRGEEAKEVQIAMKVVPLEGEASSVEMARREIQVFQALGRERHPNLLPLLFGAETDTELVLLTPYAPSGDLHSLTCIAGGCFKCLEERDGGALAEQLLEGLAALHQARYVHGDIKPHNVFLTPIEGALVAQIGDFGLTRQVPPGTEGVPGEGGTSGYMAPEMVGREEGVPRAPVSFGIDLFALGVLLYQLLSSMGPFEPPSNVRAPLEFDELCWAPLDPWARAFVAALLAKEAEGRGTAEEALRHPWLAAAAGAPRGSPRPKYAPSPEDGIRFHSAARVRELSQVQEPDLDD